MKVLIIEDETKLANALSRGLRQENYATEVYNNGEDGLAAALHDEYDLMIIDQETGCHVGEHDGAIFYTLGQRHGLNVGGGLPYYVVGKDMERNIVYASRRLDSEVFWRNELTLSQLSWINEAPVAAGDYLVRVRHRAPLKAASVRWQDGDRLVVTLKEPERAVASGQSVVIYDDQVCLGGGVVC